MTMMNIFHGIAALLFALLLELFAGNWYVVIPFSLCVLNRITARFALPYVFLCGFLTGLVLDLIYWRIYPGSALAAGSTLLAVRLLSDRAKISNTLLNALFKGALTGVLALFLMALFNGYADNRRVPYKYHLLTSFCGAVVFQVLISARSGNSGTEHAPRKEKKTPGRSAPPSTGRKKPAASASQGRERIRKKR